MGNALFVCVNSPALRTDDAANLGALAKTVGDAGLAPHLLVVDLAGGAAEVAVPGGFGSVRRIAAPQDSGDGAGVLDAIVASAAADAELVVAVGDLAARNWGARLAARLSAVFLPACDGLTVENGRLAGAEPVMGAMMRRVVGLSGQKAVVLYAGEDLAFDGGLSPLAQLAEASVEGASGLRLTARTPLPDTGGIPLKGASRIVSGGLGVGSADNWSRIDAFAARVGAAVGASRAAVDMGWVPSSRQVGFSGQKVAPDVYVAIGISGAIHHLAGIGGARKVVAVNKDPEAPIFQIADVAIVGDYNEILQAAHRKLDQA